MKKSEARKNYSDLSNEYAILYDKLLDAKIDINTTAIEDIADKYQNILARAIFLISILIETGVED